MVAISCNCFNISAHLVSPPVVTTDQKWLAEQMGTNRIGDAKFKQSVPITELDCLTAVRSVSGWKVWKCCNCNVDVCAVDISDTTRGFVNMELEEHNGNPSHRLVEGGDRIYSNCFRIILDEADSLDKLGVSRDVQAIDAFNKLQKQVDTFVSAEERMMEKRIKAFIMEQQEAFNSVQSRANKDRAIVWHRICRLNQSFATAAQSSVQVPTSLPLKVATSAPSAPAPISTERLDQNSTMEAQPPKQQPADKAADKWHAGGVAKVKAKSKFRVSSDGGIFEFDDEDEGQQTPPRAQAIAPSKLSLQHAPEGSDEEDEEEEEDGPTSAQITINPQYMGTSLPIHILNSGRGGLRQHHQQQQQLQQQQQQQQQKLQQQQQQQQQQQATQLRKRAATDGVQVTFNDLVDDGDRSQAPRESWSSEVLEELPAEVAASFAVPLSLNRRIKSLI